MLTHFIHELYHEDVITVTAIKYHWIWAVLGKVLVDRELTCIWDSLGCFCLYVLSVFVPCRLWSRSVGGGSERVLRLSM